MTSVRGSSDTLFTIFIALCTVAVTAVFVAAGSGVANLTFSPHEAHETDAGH